MATRFEFEAEVTITAQVEPQGYLDINATEIDDFEADGFNSYGNEVEETCRIRGIAILLPNEDPEGEIEAILQDNVSYEGDDLEWEVSNVSILSCVEEKMSLDEATSILHNFVSEYKDDGANEEICKAIEVVLADI